MKKKKIHFETNFWAAYVIGNPFEVIDALFDYADLEYYKKGLAEAVMYCHKKEVYKKGYPGEVFLCYAALRSFLKACSELQHKARRWQVKQAPDAKSGLHQASLTAEEYANPFRVFQGAFAEKSLEDFEFFLSEMTRLALSPYTLSFDTDLITPYIHLVKMLDACQLMRERGVERVQKGGTPAG